MGALAVFHDASYIEEQNSKLWRDTFLHVLMQMLLIVAITLLVVPWSVERPIARLAQWLHDIRAGTVVSNPDLPTEQVLRPLAQEATHLATSLRVARASAEEEARLRETADSLWTAERLRVYQQTALEGSRLFVVSNREPLMHVHRGGSIEEVSPASGLVTAMEPILKACAGTWIAHASGNADRQTVDSHDRLRVPPDAPEYTLRRVWLTTQQEERYYYGFANEGLWPLCHIAHTRPIFRADDWEAYRDVNVKFADAVLEEIADVEHPTRSRPGLSLRIASAFDQTKPARCPRHDLLAHPLAEPGGVWHLSLAAGITGGAIGRRFDWLSHPIPLQQFSRNHRPDARGRRIEWQGFSVTKGGHVTSVRPFPISVDFKECARSDSHGYLTVRSERAGMAKGFDCQADYLGIGVDRLDYTKGIPERFRGIERFLEKHPSYQGRFTHVQIGAPSRTHIHRYQDLIADVEAEAERINQRFQTRQWKPIVFLKGHHNHDEI